MKNIILFLFFILLFCNSICSLAFGWSAYGHRVVAAVAEHYCLPETKAEIAKLVGENRSLKDISNWAEEMKNKKRIVKKWHYVFIPRNETKYLPERDCPRGGCLISAVEYFRDALCDKKSSKEEREDALKFLVHLVGDVHQPLRCGYRDDFGGDEVKVFFFGRKSTLFKVWDAGILSRNELTFDDYVNKLVRRVNAERAEEVMKGTVLDWVMESRDILFKSVYDFGSDRQITMDYYVQSMAIIDQQLLKAGIRVAGILNECLGKSGEGESK